MLGMIKQKNPLSSHPLRTVVLVARGLIGGALIRRLEAAGAAVFALGSGIPILLLPVQRINSLRASRRDNRSYTTSAKCSIAGAITLL